MIKLNNIVATYTTVRGQVNAVDGVNLTIPDGKIVGIAGESGCGKSTLMKVIYGNLSYPLSLAKGDVVILDNLAAHKSPVAEAAIRARGAWLLFLPPYSPDLNPCMDGSCGSRVSIGFGEQVGCGHVYGV